jgi:hypothetical protein
VIAQPPSKNMEICIIYGRYSEWLRATRPRGRISSTGRGNISVLPTLSRPALGPTQPPIPWVPWDVSSGMRCRGKNDETWLIRRGVLVERGLGISNRYEGTRTESLQSELCPKLPYFDETWGIHPMRLRTTLPKFTHTRRYDCARVVAYSTLTSIYFYPVHTFSY